MTDITSADPDQLDAFVVNTRPGRRTTQSSQRTTAGLADRVLAGSPDYHVEVTALAALSSRLITMGENERFVATIRRELLAADRRGPDGRATITAAHLVAALDRAGIGAPPEPLPFEPATMFGLPPTSGFVDDPICAANGNMIHRDVDLDAPGIAAALTLSRTYNSLLGDRPGAFGQGWTSMLDVALVAGEGRVEIRLPDGATAAFVQLAGGWASAGRRLHALEHRPEGPDAGWTVAVDHRRTFTFDLAGTLTGWRVGPATVTVEGDEHGRISSVSELTSGRSYRVEWGEWGEAFVAAVESDDGRRVAYSRDDTGRLLRTDGFAGHLSYEWADDGHLAAVVDADGVRAFHNDYDDAGRVIRQVSPFGRTTDYRYEAEGLTVISDQAGTRQAMVHDARGNLTAVIDTDGSAMRLAYDHADRVNSVTARSGARWSYRYDDDTGELVERVDPDGLRATYEYDDAGRVVARTGRDGSRTAYEYRGDLTVPARIVGPGGATTMIDVDPALDRPVIVTDPDGAVTRIEYDRDGQITATVDALGNRHAFRYDPAGRLRRVTDPLGEVTDLVYESGRVVAAARAGARRTWARTAAGRIASGIEVDGSTWSAELGSHGAPLALVDAAGATLHLAYDPIGNVTALTAADGAVYHQHFDAVGRLIGVSDPTGTTVHRAYDVDGRLVEVVDGEGRTMSRQVDPWGRTVRSVDGTGGVTEYTRHPGGQVASITDPTGRTVTIELDAAGRIATVVSPSGARSELRFSAAGRLLERRSPAGRVERFEYDAAGRLVAVVDPIGTRHEYTLDALGRVTGLTVGGEPARSTRIEYDAHGRVAEIASPVRSVGYERDPAGRVLAIVDGTGARTELSYDDRGVLAAATDPAGAVTTYQSDARGRLTAVTAPGERITTWAYDEAGRAATITDPAGVVTQLTRDLDGLLIGLHRQGAEWTSRLDGAGREIERLAEDGEAVVRRAFDAAGRIVEECAGDLVESFLWDDDGRLQEVRGPDAADGTPTSTRLERDADGWVIAMIRQDGRRTRLDRDRRGRITAVRDPLSVGHEPIADQARVVDRAGRLLIGPDGTVYRYDAAGRLAEIAPPARDATAFEYDADGLLVVERGASVRRFRHDVAGRVVAIAVDGHGETTIEYDPAGRRVGEVAPDGTETRFEWRALDRLVAITRTSSLGTTVTVEIRTDAAGRPVRIGDQAVRYDAVFGVSDRIGSVDIAAFGTDAVSSGFGAGRGAEGVTVGPFAFLGARVLDGRTLQFLSADPLSSVPGSNGAASAYTYAWHDPVNHPDPSGLRPISQQEWDAVRTRAEQGRVGRFVEAIEEDPWGSVAAGVMVVGGAVMLFTPLAPVGAGILVGTGLSAGIGFATGTFDPRVAVVSGVVGGISFGMAGTTLSTGTRIAAETGLAFGESVATQAVTGQPIDWSDTLVSTAVGFGAAHLPTDSFATTRTRAALTGAAVDGGSSVVEQSLTGDGSISLAAVAEASLTGAAHGAISFSPDTHVDVAPTRRALPAGEPRLALPAGSPGDTITVSRDTGRVAEPEIHAETGLLVGDAFAPASFGTNGDVDIATAYSHSAHRRCPTACPNRGATDLVPHPEGLDG